MPNRLKEPYTTEPSKLQNLGLLIQRVPVIRLGYRANEAVGGLFGLVLALKVPLVGLPQRLPDLTRVTSQESFAGNSPSGGLGQRHVQPNTIVQIRENIRVEQSDAFKDHEAFHDEIRGNGLPGVPVVTAIILHGKGPVLQGREDLSHEPRSVESAPVIRPLEHRVRPEFIKGDDRCRQPLA